MSVLDIDPEQPAFVRVPAKCIAMVVAALRAGGCAEEADEVEVFAKQYTDPVRNALREKWPAMAEDMIGDGEIEFDIDAAISEWTDGTGAYVLGWLRVEED